MVGQRRRSPGTKLAVPDIAAHAISRPRLVAMLTEASRSAVTLVSAPAGAGKTALLTEWAHARTGTAWVSLDGDDNDDRQFWSAVLDALPVPDSLAVPAHPGTDPDFLAEVVNALDVLTAPVVLVLDDLHEITGPLRGLDALIRHQPAGLRLVLSTRHDPPLRLGRLRLTDQLAEIRDLAFTPDETRALLDAAGVHLDPGRLLAETEGWAAGLRLAVRPQPGRSVAAYLADEVLSCLSHPMCDLLRTVSVCEDVPAELAVCLSGRDDACSVLDAVAARTSLVGRADAGYHVHAMLRTHLLADLTRRSPTRVAALHGRAADWYLAHDRPEPALAHATRAGDRTRTAALLHDHAVPLALSGRHDLVRAALDVAGTREDSVLALVSALLHLARGHREAADRDAAHAAAAWPDRPTAELASLRHLVRSRRAQLTGDVDEMVRATAPLEVSPYVAPALVSRAIALLAAGDREGARVRSAEALRSAGNQHVAAQCLATLAAADDDYGRMATLAAEADQEGTPETVAMTAPLLAYTALLRADPAECRRQALRVPWPQPATETLRGAAEFALGDQHAGLHRVRTARLATGATRLPATQVAVCAVLEQRMALALGRGEDEALDWARHRIPDAPECLVLRARAYLAFGRRDAAEKALHPVLDGTPLVRWVAIEAWLVHTEIALHAGNAAIARRSLATALAIAARLGVCYPLVFAAPDVAALLTTQLGRFGGPAGRLAEHVVARRQSLHVPLSSPLTAREQAVLGLLPTHRCLDEIAEDLAISANTVKTHVRAIYLKLGVTRRRDAVTTATERGLLRDA